jgi:hypothetical protein
VTDQATRVVPAGWYQDPALSEQVRWWNGLAWTEHVREKPNAAIAGAAPADNLVVTAASTSVAEPSITVPETTEQRIAASRELERQFGIGISENEIVMSATALGYGAGANSATDADTGSGTNTATATPINPAGQQAAGGLRAHPGVRTTARTATGGAWLIALTPLLAVAVAIAAAYVYFYVSANPVVFLVAFLLPYLLGFLWALSDGRTSLSRGFDAPSSAWALLGGLGYLIVRRLRVAGSGPLAMFLVVGALAIGLPAAAYASGGLKPLSNALTIQNAISSDYVASGRATAVNCPPFVDAATLGTLYTCNATLANGVSKPVWVSIDGDQGQFSYSMGL